MAWGTVTSTDRPLFARRFLHPIRLRRGHPAPRLGCACDRPKLAMFFGPMERTRRGLHACPGRRHANNGSNSSGSEHALPHLPPCVYRGRRRRGKGCHARTCSAEGARRARGLSHLRALQPARERDLGSGCEVKHEPARARARRQGNEAHRAVPPQWHSALRTALRLRRERGCEGGGTRARSGNDRRRDAANCV